MAKANGFTIESGVPMPGRDAGEGLYAAISQLEVGQSFLVPESNGNPASALTYAKHKHPGRQYAQRTVDGGKRVWRTA